MINNIKTTIYTQPLYAIKALALIQIYHYYHIVVYL